MPQLRINGEHRQVAAGTVTDLLDELGLDRTAVAVELNRKIVPRGAYPETRLAESDELEIVTIVGGG